MMRKEPLQKTKKEKKTRNEKGDFNFQFSFFQLIGTC